MGWAANASTKDMTPQLATSLRIHDPEVGTPAPTGDLVAVAPQAPALPLPGAARRESDGECAPWLLRGEALHRRLLGMADVLATTIALFVVIDLLGDDRPAPAALLVTPLVVVLFKVAGLYHRDEVRLVHSTLDEAPLLLQLTGLFALCVTILEPILLEGTLGPAQIAGLWLGAFAAVLSG